MCMLVCPRVHVHVRLCAWHLSLSLALCTRLGRMFALLALTALAAPSQGLWHEIFNPCQYSMNPRIRERKPETRTHVIYILVIDYRLSVPSWPWNEWTHLIFEQQKHEVRELIYIHNTFCAEQMHLIIERVARELIYIQNTFCIEPIGASHDSTCGQGPLSAIRIKQISRTKLNPKP